MRHRNNNCLLKIAVIFSACILLFSLWHITYGRRKAYLLKFLNDQKINEFYEKIQSPKLQIRQNGEFWILENYIIASRQFSYLESITYTTHADFTFLDNLEEVTRRWRAPISIAIFAPGLDFYRTMYSIEYLRSCSTEQRLIRELVTFHIYFSDHHMPSFIPKTELEFNMFSSDCSERPPYITDANESYRHNYSILYPINVGRNIARRLARTHFIFPCDIEMYPNWNFVDDFLNLIHRQPNLLLSERQVYPLAVFEVKEDQEIPKIKTDLLQMIETGKAIPFHKNICVNCHTIPELNRWLNQKGTDSLGIFLVTKHRPSWEPFYVTTNLEPYFDERYTWEGKYDKQIQTDLLGIMNYNFCILDNAFLVHRPGIKEYSEKRTPEIERMMMRTMLKILPQLRSLYGQSLGEVDFGTV